MKFRLVRGLHNDGEKTYQVGDIIETDIDLAAKFNQPSSGSIKFEPLSMVSPAQSQADTENLSKLTVKQLKEIAEDNEIDLEGCSTKDEILNAVQGALECA